MSPGIAIVGMACRFAGARSPAELWETVLARRREFRRIPAERLRVEDYLERDPADPDGLYAAQAAVIEGWEFDRVRFRVAGDTFRSADLAHWLALEVAADALADAGFPDGDGLPREATGVLLGNSLTGEFSRANLLRLRWPYVQRVAAAALRREGWERERIAALLARLEAEYKAPFPPPGEESLAGSLSNTIAGRICNHFDLHGGGYTLDGACASSLLAVANACSALTAGDLDAALAGGVDLSLDPFELVGFARTGALAPGEMRVYDARSAGFIPGEGSGFVVLMREADAVRRGCRIHAVIRGWGISSDGHGGISRPEAAGQRLALERAYRRAGFGIETIGYFEGHGTGTAVGDAAELRALAETLAAARPEGAPPPDPLPAIGSIKANIGHTKAAAGVAGLIKATLVLAEGLLPPNTGCEEPHPAFTEAPPPVLRVLARGEPWPAGRPLRAAVSAMGFGGINAHVVLAATAAAAGQRPLTARERTLLGAGQDAELLLLSAGSAAELLAQAERLRDLAPRLSRSELTDVAATLAGGLGLGLTARAAVVAATPAEAASRLARLCGLLRSGAANGFEPKHGVFFQVGEKGPCRVGFLFPGQGSPPHLPPDADPLDTAVAQPAIVAHSLAGLAELARLGVRGDVAVGHSLGEITALCWAGACDEATAIQLAAARGRAMADAGEPGAMASLGAPPAEAADLAAGTGAVIAAFNAPARTVVAGPPAAIEMVLARAASRRVTAARLRVARAFHTPGVAAAAPGLADALAAARAAGRLHPPERPVASTVTGAWLFPTTDLAELLVRQVTSPVRFQEALAAARDGADLWLEVGPGHALAGLAAESLAAPILALYICGPGGPSLAGFLAAAGAAFVRGLPIDPSVLFAGRFSRPFDLDRPLRFLANPCESAAVPAELFPAAWPAPLPAVNRRETAAATTLEEIETAAPAPLEVVRLLVARRAELPPSSVRDDSRLLSDLHLNSISVGQLVAEAARRLGLRPPASPADFAQATVAEVAGALAEQAALAPAGDVPEPAAAPPGVDAWVRPFTLAWVARELPRARAEAAAGKDGEDGKDGKDSKDGWTIVAPEDYRQPLASALADVPSPGVALCLPPATADEAAMELFLSASRAVLAAPRPGRFLAVHAGGGLGGFARTLHLELPAWHTAVVELPFSSPAELAAVAGRAAAEARAVHGYAEARYDTAGRRAVPVLRLLPPAPAGGQLPLNAGDVLLATGGGKGIAAECAFDLARASGVRLALLGRARPEEDGELAANLERLRAAGVTAMYLPCDVTDGAAVEAAVARAEVALGPVTAVLHGAGANAPRLLGALDAAGFAATVAPKVHGLDHVLAAVDPARLRLLVAFGSIIARTGLPGEAEYATANEWLAQRVERFARRHPGCRAVTLEWSVWSGLGMGEKLGTLERLIRQGITPIPPDAGMAALRELLSRPELPSTVVVAGRFGEPPTIEIERPELPLHRFLERVRAYYPGVELVVDAEVSADTDPHLADHVFRGEPLFAAVLGLEAMAQAAMAVAGTDELPVFERVELARPVAVPAGRRTILRIAALVRSTDTVEVVLRDAATGFQADHFRAICRFAPAPAAPARGRLFTFTATAAQGESGIEPGRDLYGGLLFHRGRFQRLQAYRQLRATECLADISPDGAVSWFGRWLPGDLRLGDPGARDAAIHGIQACIPHAVLLPTGVDRIVCGRLDATEPLTFAARERPRAAGTAVDDFVYDVEILGPGGELRESWEGLRLRAVDRAAAPASWSAALLAPYVERRLADLLPGAGVRVAIERRAAREDGAAVAAGLLGGESLHHRPDGAPHTGSGTSRVSLAHAGDLVLAVAAGGGGQLGCDLEPVAARAAALWRDLLGEERYRLAERIAAERGEDADAAATRVWAAAESLKKAGVPWGSPLTLDTAEDPSPRPADGWLVLRAGRLRIGTLVAPVRELAGPAALAVLAESDAARL